MGLDMYATKIKAPAGVEVPQVDLQGDKALMPVEDGVRNWAGSVKQAELHYWRKHPNLHGWMRDLYERKGGKDEEFNCSYVRLDEIDLTELEKDVRNGGLPPTQGSFFGYSDGSEVEDDLRFIADARAAIADGWTVVYSAWW